MPASSSAKVLPLQGKRLLITGASGGIGRAVALSCSREGAAVIGLGYRGNTTAAENLAFTLQEESGARSMLLPFDVSRGEEVEAAIGRFVESAGGIDGLLLCAGVAKSGLLLTTPLEEVAATLNVNLLGAIACCRAALPAMLRQRSGVIVLFSSVAAERPYRGQAAYAASKGGIEALCRALAVEYAPKGIRVTCVRPGPIDTGMLESTRTLGQSELLGRVPARRLGTPEEVAGLATFLLSDRAAYVTGSVHAVDGGYQIG